MARDRSGVLTSGVRPWWRRLHLALNYLPVVFGGIFAVLLAVVSAGWRTPAIGVVALLAGWVVIVTEVMGRRPYLKREESVIVVRNFLRVRRVDQVSVTGAVLRTFILGKDTCPALRTDGGRLIPVVAYFGRAPSDLAADLRLR